MFDVERPIWVSCDTGHTVLLDNLDHFLVWTAVADTLVVQILDDFHRRSSFLFSLGTMKIVQDVVVYIQILHFHVEIEYICRKGMIICQK